MMRNGTQVLLSPSNPFLHHGTSVVPCSSLHYVSHSSIVENWWIGASHGKLFMQDYFICGEIFCLHEFVVIWGIFYFVMWIWFQIFEREAIEIMLQWLCSRFLNTFRIVRALPPPKALKIRQSFLTHTLWTLRFWLSDQSVWCEYVYCDLWLLHCTTLRTKYTQPTRIWKVDKYYKFYKSMF